MILIIGVKKYLSVDYMDVVIGRNGCIGTDLVTTIGHKVQENQFGSGV